MNDKLLVPFGQPLSPAVFLPWRSGMNSSFPFSSERTRHYYLARNGIWHGADSIGLKPGDKILMPSYHHGIEVEVLLQKGMQLVFYRVDRNMNIDIDDLEKKITPGIRALYAIHYLGFPQPVEKLQQIAKANNLLFIEDCALSLFSRTADKPLGAYGDLSIFCLYKSLPVPHGGMLVLNKNDIALPPLPESPGWISTAAYVTNRLLNNLDLSRIGIGRQLASLIRSAGRQAKKTAKTEAISVDTNLFDQTHIMLGMSPLARYLLDRIDGEEVARRRRENYKYLASLLDESVRLQFKELPQGACPLSFPILVKDKPGVWARLLADGVETVNFWSRRHPVVPEGEFPDAEFLRDHVLEVPIYQGLSKKHLEFIASKLQVHARW